jgi:hypothetical protein
MPAPELAARAVERAARRGEAVAVATEPDPLRALEASFAHGDTVCVAGSIFLAGAVREALSRRAILR